jgi:hypothetical protein
VAIKDSRFANALVEDPRYARDPSRKQQVKNANPDKLGDLIREKKSQSTSKSQNVASKELSGMVANIKQKFGKEK